jgi:hypothetical protein
VTCLAPATAEFDGDLARPSAVAVRPSEARRVTGARRNGTQSPFALRRPSYPDRKARDPRVPPHTVKLVRFAYMDVDEGPIRPSDLRLNVGDVEVVPWVDVGTVESLLSGQVALSERPRAQNGDVVVPDAARRKAERALELAANIVAIGNAGRSRLSSPGFCVAFIGEDDDEAEWLDGQRGIPALGKLTSRPLITIPVEPALFAQLGDRPDGIALLSEALAHDRLLARFRDLFRVFERAFRKAPTPLVPLLAEFLGRRPRLGYDESEVERWKRIRHKASHADRRRFALEADVRPVYARVLLAAYEVVLNKRNWASSSVERDARWSPSTGVLDRDGHDVFVVQGSQPPLGGTLYDGFDAYPVHLDAPGFQLPERYWPRSGPTKSRTRKFKLDVVAPDDIALLRPS